MDCAYDTLQFCNTFMPMYEKLFSSSMWYVIICHHSVHKQLRNWPCSKKSLITSLGGICNTFAVLLYIIQLMSNVTDFNLNGTHWYPFWYVSRKCSFQSGVRIPEEGRNIPYFWTRVYVQGYPWRIWAIIVLLGSGGWSVINDHLPPGVLGSDVLG